MAFIFSENPEYDLWRELLQFSYKANIERFLNKKALPVDDNTINCISGCFLQAYEYYKSAKEANIQIAPLLLYYGSTNLLYGMINLLSGSINKIENHGMKAIISKDESFIADTNIQFFSPVNGGVHVISRLIGINCDLTKLGGWKLSEFLDSIAEINTDYIQCYNKQTGCVALLDVFNTPDGKAEKIYFSSDNKEEIKTLLSNVEGFSNSYLQVTTARDFETQKEYFVLRHKLNGRDISERSYSGQPYLKAGHRKNGKLITLPSMINMYISLFALASLCRYHPERWSPFIINDSTGEKLLIEKFLYYSRRMIPNYVLNTIVGETVRYTSSDYSEKSTVKTVGEHQVKEMIEKNIREQIDKQIINQNMNFNS